MATIQNKEGLLDYGDDDGTVIWRSPLTSEASIITPEIGGGTYVKIGGGQVFDAIKGVKTGATGHYYYDNMINNNQLDYGGQIVFDVETEMIACSNADSEGSSGGRAQTANEVFMGFKANPATSGNYQMYVSINAKTVSLALGDGTTIFSKTTKVSDAIGKGQFTTIHIAWNGNRAYLFVNKVLIGFVTRAKNMPSPFYRLVLGSYPYTPAVPLISGYIRNLQVSSRQLTLSSHPVLSMVQVFGDSYADTVYVSQSSTWDMEKSLNMEQEFFKIGMKFGIFNTQSYGGRKVIGSGNATLYLIDNIVTALAQRPTCVIFQGGANDLTTNGTLNTTAFSDSMKAMIEKFFGINGNPGTTVQRMLVCSTPWPPNYPDATQSLLRKPDISSIATIQASLPSWFDTTYPSLAGRLAYQDTFSDFGGFNPDPSLYGISDTLHPINKGRYTMGKSWARGVKKLMRN